MLAAAESSCTTHSDLAPDAVQARQALVALDASVAAVALGRRVTLHPYMLHSLGGGKDKSNIHCYLAFHGYIFSIIISLDVKHDFKHGLNRVFTGTLKFFLQN